MSIRIPALLGEYRRLRESVLRRLLEFTPTESADAELARLQAALDAALEPALAALVADAEQTRKRCEERLHALLEPWTQANWEADADGRVDSDSPTWRAYTGQTLEEMWGFGWFDAVHPEDRAAAASRLQQGLVARKPVSNEFRVRRRSGEWCWTVVRVSPLFDEAGNVRRWVGLNVDVSEAKRTEEALRASEERHRRFIEQLADGIFAADASGRYTDVNPAGCALLGRTREEIIGSTFLDVLAPEEHARLPAAIDSFADGLVHRSVWRYRRKHGSEFLGELDGRRLPDGSFVGVLRDVTARRAAEEERRLSEERALLKAAELETVLDAVPAAVWIARDPLAERIDANRRGAELLRIPTGTNMSLSAPGEERPAHFSVQQHGRTLAPHELPMQRAARGETVREFEEDVVFDDGSVLRLLGGAVPLRNPAGEVVGAVGSFIDVTDRMRAEEELRRSDQQKSDFLAVLSHELRNPLAPLRNSLHLLDRVGAHSDEARTARDVMRRQTEHLTRLVDDLLDLTRIDRGKTELQRAVLDLRDVVHRTSQDHLGTMAQAGLALRVHLPEAPVWVDGDETRLSQVLGNLLQNAIKFTPRGGSIEVSVVAPEPIEGSAPVAVLSVKDSGVGMEPGTELSMFEPFSQGAQNLARTHGGLGLGLALVKAFVQMHQGTVRAESDGPGRGSEFEVCLPRASAPGQSVVAAPSPSVTPRHILIVEDNQDAAQTLAAILELSGHTVRLAADARTGLALAREFRPDVILCDIGLPDLDGYQCAELVRADPALAHVRLIAITGYAQPEDRERARKRGFDAHLPKPPDLKRLEELLGSMP